MPSTTVCPFAWDSAAIRPNGEVIPCCLFKNYLNRNNNWGIINSNLDFRNNDLWRNLRRRMLSGEQISECRDCYAIEDQGHASMRTANLDRLPNTLTEECLALTYLEMSFSNLCNLACVSCSVYCSSKWGTEDYKKNPQIKISSLVEHNVEITDLSKLTTLKIIGGEPLMEQARFIELLKKLNLNQLTLMISTNGTVLPSEELKSLLDQCQRVVIDVSIDGIGSVGEWYRWPTKFAAVEQTITQFEQWWANDNRVTLNTKTLINLFNVWTLDQIVNYVAVDHPAWTMYFDWIDHPDWQKLSQIPDEYKPALIKQLEQWNATSQRPWHPNFNNPYETSILKLNEPSTVDWPTIKEKTLTLATDRGLNVLNMLPKMENLLNA
jgi:radical SAM protein with 4Fe4S-binding SPASM domain